MLNLPLTVFAIAVMMASGPAFGQQDDLADQLMDADEKQFAVIFPKIKEQAEQVLPNLISEIERKPPPGANDEAKEKLAKRQANAAVVLLRLNQPSKVWPLLKHSPDPRVRTYLIHRFAPLGADPNAIFKHLDEEPDITIRRALLLSLGEFDEKALSQEDRKALLPKLQDLYREDADPGLRAASEWLLRKWGQEDWLKRVSQKWANNKDQRTKRLEGIQQLVSQSKEKTLPQWYVNSQSQTMVVIPGPVEFMMDSPMTEVGRDNEKLQNKRRIDRSFAIGSTEVTVEQFRRFYKDHYYFEAFSPTDDCPVNSVSWYDAVKYCNWLNEREGIPKDQWCYVPNEDGKYEVRMTMDEAFLHRTGYRLPTEAEWDFACRADAVTRFSFGESEELLGRYGWFVVNSSGHSHPVGSMRPNDLGLFDMNGNIWERCQDVMWADNGGKAIKDREENLLVNDQDTGMLRGGSFNHHSSLVRSAFRFSKFPSPWHRDGHIGFRLSRTLPPVDSRNGR